LVAVALAASVAWTVKFAVPAAVGVPAIAPAALSVSPAGRFPDVTDHVYGLLPPDAAKFWEYADPTVAFGSVLVVTDKGAAAMVRLKLFVVFAFAASLTCTVKFAFAAAVGVPPIAPAELSVRPAGRLPLNTVHVYEPVPPLAASV
jgi:hypothetical protein